MIRVPGSRLVGAEGLSRQRSGGPLAAEICCGAAGLVAFLCGASFNSFEALAAIPLNLTPALEATVEPADDAGGFVSFAFLQSAELPSTAFSGGPLNAPDKTTEPDGGEATGLCSNCADRLPPDSRAPFVSSALGGEMNGGDYAWLAAMSAASPYYGPHSDSRLLAVLSDGGGPPTWVVLADDRGVYGVARPGPHLSDPRWRSPGWHDESGLRRVIARYVGN